MRVIAGIRKGHRLLAPHGNRVRPTSDRVRTVLFDILGASVAGAKVLDLFAGAGGLGIEALSRGAASADFVDNDRGHAETIRANLSRTHLDDRGRVIVQDALAYLSAGEMRHSYTLIFADPPYQFSSYETLLDLAARHGNLAEGGRMILEVSSRTESAPKAELLDLIASRTVGETALLFYQAKHEQTGDLSGNL